MRQSAGPRNIGNLKKEIRGLKKPQYYTRCYTKCGLFEWEKSKAIFCVKIIKRTMLPRSSGYSGKRPKRMR